MKACNVKVYDKLIEYLNSCDDDYVEVIVCYKDNEQDIKHNIIQYHKTLNGWYGSCGSMFDFDFFDIKEVVSFTPLSEIALISDSINNEDISFNDEEPNYDDLKEIQVDDIQKGDYVCVECERLYNSTSYLEILDIGIMFDSQTGAIIKTVTTEDEIWSTKDGSCISNPNSFYEAVGYYRKTK